MQELEQKVNSMSQELALFQMNELERNNALEKRIKELEATSNYQLLKNTIGELVNKIKTLEEARQRQIQLNSTFAVKIEVPAQKIDRPATTHSIWDLFK